MTADDLERRVERLERERTYGDLDAGELYLLMLRDCHGEDFPGAADAFMARLRQYQHRERLRHGRSEDHGPEADHP